MYMCNIHITYWYIVITVYVINKNNSALSISRRHTFYMCIYYIHISIYIYIHMYIYIHICMIYADIQRGTQRFCHPIFPIPGTFVRLKVLTCEFLDIKTAAILHLKKG